MRKTILSAAIASMVFAGGANAGVISIASGQGGVGVIKNSPGVVDQYAPGQGNYKSGASLGSGAGYTSRAANMTIAQEVFGRNAERVELVLPDVEYQLDAAKAKHIRAGHAIRVTLDRSGGRFANGVTANQIQIGTLAPGKGFVVEGSVGTSTLSLTLDELGALELAKGSAESSIVRFNFRTPNTSSRQSTSVNDLSNALRGDSTFLGQSDIGIAGGELSDDRPFHVTLSALLDTTVGPNAGSAQNNDSTQPLMIFTSLPAVYWDVLNVNKYGQNRVLYPLNDSDRKFDTSASANPEVRDNSNYGDSYARLGSVRLGVNQDVLNAWREGERRFFIETSDQLSTYIAGNFSGIKSVALTTSSCREYKEGVAGAAHVWQGKELVGKPEADGVTQLWFGLSNNDANKVYNICAVADGVTPMAAQQNFAVGNLIVNFTNYNYVDRVLPGGKLDHFWRNSCVASLFNLPNSSNSDIFYIRLTNTSNDGRSGGVRGVLYDENGKRYPAKGSASLVDQSGKTMLRAHETGIYTVRQVASAFGVDGANWNGANGRARLVLEGDFPSCEALGLLRMANGTLVNMTATTQGNFNGDGPSTTVGHNAGNNRN